MSEQGSQPQMAAALAVVLPNWLSGVTTRFLAETVLGLWPPVSLKEV